LIGVLNTSKGSVRALQKIQLKEEKVRLGEELKRILKIIRQPASHTQNGCVWSPVFGGAMGGEVRARAAKWVSMILWNLETIASFHILAGEGHQLCPMNC